MILGDDIVITDDRLAQEYVVLMKQLDVTINQNKTMISEHMYEFAKRQYYRGIEITGLPLKEVLGIGAYW